MSTCLKMYLFYTLQHSLSISQLFHMELASACFCDTLSTLGPICNVNENKPWTQMWTFHELKKFCKNLVYVESVTWFILCIIISPVLCIQQVWVFPQRIMNECYRLENVRKIKLPFSFLPLWLLLNLEWVSAILRMDWAY